MKVLETQYVTILVTLGALCGGRHIPRCRLTPVEWAKWSTDSGRPWKRLVTSASNKLKQAESDERDAEVYDLLKTCSLGERKTYVAWTLKESKRKEKNT